MPKPCILLILSLSMGHAPVFWYNKSYCARLKLALQEWDLVEFCHTLQTGVPIILYFMVYLELSSSIRFHNVSDVHLKLQHRFPNLTLVHNKLCGTLFASFSVTSWCVFLFFWKNQTGEATKLLISWISTRKKNLSRSIVWGLLCYCVRARDNCCVLCDVTRNILFTWYMVHQPKNPIQVITSPGYHFRSFHLRCFFLTQEQTQEN